MRLNPINIENSMSTEPTTYLYGGKPTQIDPLPPNETAPLRPFQTDPQIPAETDPLKMV